MKKLFSYIFIGIIKTYQNMISPLLPARCRYRQTCSEYGVQAIKKHGIFKGGFFIIKRVLTCHPWGGDGYDPVP